MEADELRAEVKRLAIELKIAHSMYDVTVKERDHERHQVNELRAEVERLRAEVKHWREARASAIEAGDAMQAERDALRALIADAVIDALAEPNHDYPCRSDGRCQYAIDHGAEGMGHCPKGKCALAAPLLEPAQHYASIPGTNVRVRLQPEHTRLRAERDALAERLRKPLTDEEIADAVQAERDSDE